MEGEASQGDQGPQILPWWLLCDFKAQFCGELAKQNRNGGEMEVVTLTDLPPLHTTSCSKLINEDIAVIASRRPPAALPRRTGDEVSAGRRDYENRKENG